jgi:hypothetical protein
MGKRFLCGCFEFRLRATTRMLYVSLSPQCNVLTRIVPHPDTYCWWAYWPALRGCNVRVCYLPPPLWSSGQSFWLQIQRSRVRFPELPDFLSSSGSGTGSTQPREVNRGATWITRNSGSRSRKQRLTSVGIRCADHVTPLYPQKLALTSPTGGGRSVSIVRSRIMAT